MQPFLTTSFLTISLCLLESTRIVSNLLMSILSGSDDRIDRSAFVAKSVASTPAAVFKSDSVR